MIARQRGATFLGILVIAAILGFALYAGMRLVPIYYEYLDVVRGLDKLVSEFKGDVPNPQTIRNSLDRQWGSVDDVKSIDAKDVEIKKVSGGYSVRAAYRAEAPFIANISLVVDFDKTVTVGGGTNE
jgi:Domain of unknown function (DUF4845)